MQANRAAETANWRIYFGAGAFYTATAIPMSYFFYLLPALMRQFGHSPETIGLLALVYLPYALRVLWAPLVDAFAKSNPARLRAVMVLSIVAAAGGVLCLMLVEPERDIAAIMTIATAIFVALSTGTTALDGYAIATLNSFSRRHASIAQTVGFTFGGILLGAGALVSDGLDWSTVALLIAMAALVAALPVMFMPSGHALHPATATGARQGRERTFLTLLKRPDARRLLLLSVCVKIGLGMEAAYLPIWQVDSGVPASFAGFFGALGSNVLGLAAAFVSGFFLLRGDGWRTTGWMCVIAALLFAFAATAHQALVGPALAVTLSLAFLSLGYAYIAPFKALSLEVSEGGQAASKAAFLASIDLILSIGAASVSGFLVTRLGLGGFFWLSMALCVAGAFTAFTAKAEAGYPPLSTHPKERL